MYIYIYVYPLWPTRARPMRAQLGPRLAWPTWAHKYPQKPSHKKPDNPQGPRGAHKGPGAPIRAQGNPQRPKGNPQRPNGAHGPKGALQAQGGPQAPR